MWWIIEYKHLFVAMFDKWLFNCYLFQVLNKTLIVWNLDHKPMLLHSSQSNQLYLCIGRVSDCKIFAFIGPELRKYPTGCFHFEASPLTINAVA